MCEFFRGIDRDMFAFLATLYREGKSEGEIDLAARAYREGRRVGTSLGKRDATSK